MFHKRKHGFNEKIIVDIQYRLFNPGAPGAGSSCHFRLSNLILRDTEVIATHGFFFKNSGHRFLTDIKIQNTNNMKDQLTIKNN